MTSICEYTLPGIHVSDHVIPVPLKWKECCPGEVIDSTKQPTIDLFYRVLCDPQRLNDHLPLIVFLQGGPGGQSPRPLSAHSPRWLSLLLRHFRVVFPDQRGTGRSSAIDSSNIERIGTAQEQADYLKCFLADSIVRDIEHLRLTEFNAQQWYSLGQSYGGFLTLTYLSFFPEALLGCFVTGGIAPVGLTAQDVYHHTFDRMADKSRALYARYPHLRSQVMQVLEEIRTHAYRLPNGDPLTCERLQSIPVLGRGSGKEDMLWLFDSAFTDNTSSHMDSTNSTQSFVDRSFANTASTDRRLSFAFLQKVEAMTQSSPLYWPLQEFIYGDGKLTDPINWSAYREYCSRPEFSTQAEEFLFTGEAIFPWMFKEFTALQPFKSAVEILMEETEFGQIYDQQQLAENTVPVYAAVYDEDMYVDSRVQRAVLDTLGNSHRWVTNEFEHDGLHQGEVLEHLFDMASSNGDLFCKGYNQLP